MPPPVASPAGGVTEDARRVVPQWGHLTHRLSGLTLRLRLGDAPYREVMISSEKQPGRPTILVAEDDIGLRDIVAEILESSGYDVVAADDGEQALAYLTAAPQAPAAVLLDLMMPVASGWDCIDVLKSNARLSWIPIVIMSELDVAPIGADLFLKKPFRVDELLATIDHFARPRPDRGRDPLG